MYFIDEVIEKIKGDHPTETFGDIAVIFPNRRAGVFFNRKLSGHFDSPVWSPQVFSIRDLVGKLSPYTIPDQVTLVFELYQVFRNLGYKDTLENFYSWGELLIKEFDEIDKYLIDGDELFRTVYEIKEIESHFGPVAEDIESLKMFWEDFYAGDQDELKKSFLHIWDLNRKAYSLFKEKLTGKNEAYEGLAYRHLLNDIRGKKITLPWKHIYFCGFNALNKVEKEIIRLLVGEGMADLIWDMDNYYFSDPVQEAGKFLRRNQAEGLPMNNEIPERLAKNPKEITITGIPLHVGQAKYLGEILKGINASDLKETAVILPDEKMLSPILNSIPSSIDAVNITMGVSFTETPVYNLIENLINLREYSKKSGSQRHYYHRTVNHLLNSPMVAGLLGEHGVKINNFITEKNIIYIGSGKIMEMAGDNPLISGIFSPEEDKDLSGWLRDIFGQITRAGQGSPLEKEFSFRFLEVLNRYSSLMEKFGEDITESGFWLILKKLVRQEKISFEGMPLEGLQVMGMLETRNLDFKNLIILSMNEGTLPAGDAGSLLIPYNIRKGFGLPTVEDDDALYAYYFYRLLQRAENISLLYNTESEGSGNEEKSRFLVQIEKELVRENPQIKLRKEVLSLPVIFNEKKEIIIPKDQFIQNSLKKYFFGDNDEVPRYLSPSALVTFIECPLKFYFKYPARVEEKPSVSDILEANTFGTIFHEVMENLYKKHLEERGADVTTESFSWLKGQVDTALKDAFRNNFLQDLEFLEGKNLITYQVIEKLIHDLLEKDRRDAPFKLVELEAEDYFADMDIEVGQGIRKVRLKGKIDRVDEKGGLRRIIDYKTGKVDKLNQNLEKLFLDPSAKISFQLLWYGMLYLESHPDENISVAAYPVKSYSSPLSVLSLKSAPSFEGTPTGNFEKRWKGLDEKDLGALSSLDQNNITAFKELLKGKLEDLFDPEQPFIQNKTQNVCDFCPYKGICY